MAFQDEKEGERRRRPDVGQENDTDRPKSPRRGSDPGTVGNALRSVYKNTLDEDIPPEMLDLLGKLG